MFSNISMYFDIMNFKIYCDNLNFSFYNFTILFIIQKKANIKLTFRLEIFFFNPN